MAAQRKPREQQARQAPKWRIVPRGKQGMLSIRIRQHWESTKLPNTDEGYARAEEIAAQLYAALITGDMPTKRNAKIRDVHALYMMDVKRRKLTPEYQVALVAALNHIVPKSINHKMSWDLIHQDVRRWQKTTKLSGESQNTQIRHFSAFLSWSFRNGYLNKKISLGDYVVTVPNKEPEEITYEQSLAVAALFREGWKEPEEERQARVEKRRAERASLNARRAYTVNKKETKKRKGRRYRSLKPDPEAADYTIFMWYCGSRPTETLRLDWPDLVEHQGVQCVHIANRMDGKDEYIAITPEMAQILERQRLRYIERVKQASIDAERPGPKTGLKAGIKRVRKPAKPTGIWRFNEGSYSVLLRRFKLAAKILGFDRRRFGFKAYRVSLATRLLERDTPLTIVQDIMRHRDINTTKKHYAKKRIPRMLEEMNRVNAIDAAEAEKKNAPPATADEASDNSGSGQSE